MTPRSPGWGPTGRGSKNRVLPIIHTRFRIHFHIHKSLRVFVLTLAGAVLVLGAAAYGGDSALEADVLWQSLLIAAVVAIGAGWLPLTHPSPASPAKVPEGANDPHAGASVSSLEEQGLTAKLLELIALGDRYGNVFSVALISIDHLEEIRERAGEAATARLLSEVLTALTHTLRMPDRVGEFDRGTYLVVLPETKLPGAVQIAERLRVAVSGLDVPASPRVQVHTTASIGVTSFRRGDDLQSLLDRVQRTLHAAQEQGHNRVLPDLAA